MRPGIPLPADGVPKVAAGRIPGGPDKPGGPGPGRPGGSGSRSALGILATRIAVYPITIATGIVVARVLGPSDRGAFAFLTLLGSFVLPLLTLGFGAGIIYLVSSGRAAVPGVATAALLVGFLQGGLTAAVVWLLWRLGWAGATAANVPPGAMGAALLLLPVQGMVLMASRLVLGASWFSLGNWLAVAVPLLNAVALTALVVLGGWGVAGAVAALCVSNVASLAVHVAAIGRRFGMRLRPTPGFLGGAFSYGVRAWPGDLAIRANLRLDQLLLGFWGGSASLGLYSVAVNLSELLWLLPDSAGPVLYNRLAPAAQEQERRALVARAHRVLLAGVVLPAAVLALVGGPVVRLFYGEAFAGAGLPLLLLLPGTVASTTAKVLTKYFAASGAPGKSSGLQIAGFAVSGALYVGLIPVWGAVGAALASSLGYAAAAGVSLWLFRGAQGRGPSFFRPTLADWAWLTGLARSVLDVRVLRRAPVGQRS